MNRNDENLEQLLRQFVDQDQAQSMAREIEQADDLFAAHPVPLVSPQAVVRIQFQVQKQLKHKQHTGITWIVAAGLAAILMMGLYSLLSQQMPMSPRPDSGPIAQNIRTHYNAFNMPDAATLEIENEISHLMEAIENINEPDDEPFNLIQINLNQLEDELTSGSTEFWKG
jgi:hypothetical protein